ncbi:MAG: hypothetical protein ACKOD2_19985 [Ilumatobacteraceae bacterium]
MNRLSRTRDFGNDIIVVDGMWGAGKSAISGVIGSMERVEKKRINSIFEYVCVGRHLDKISDDFAATLLSTLADSLHYDTMIGREVNLRWADDSGARDTLRRARYVRRLFTSDGDVVVSRIMRDNLAAHFVTHEMLGISEPMFDTFGRRLHMIWITRHPMHMLTYFAAYLTRYDNVREFTMSIEVQGERVPWFGAPIADRWLTLSPTERAVYCLDHLYRLSWRHLDRSIPNTTRILTIQFENFVVRPDLDMASLASFLDREHHPKVARLLRRARIPRPSASSGGRTFSALASTSGARMHHEERLAYRALLDDLNTSIGEETQATLQRLVAEYNERHPSDLAAFATEHG